MRVFLQHLSYFISEVWTSAPGIKWNRCCLQDCYIVDNGEVGVWVWCGRHASKREKQESVNNAAVCKHDVVYSAIVTYSSLVEEWPQAWKTWNTQRFLWTWKTQGIIREFRATTGNNCHIQSSFSSTFKYLCKTAADWVNRISHGHSVVVTCYIAGVDVEWPSMKVIINYCTYFLLQ